MNPLFARCIAKLMAVLIALLIAGLAAASTFTVTSTTDSGASLRAVIIALNADNSASAAAPHKIVFAIPGAGVHTITPSAQFPFIVRPVVIDGFTQPGSSANTLTVGNDSVHQIELDGTNANISNACFFFLISYLPQTSTAHVEAEARFGGRRGSVAAPLLADRSDG